MENTIGRLRLVCYPDRVAPDRAWLECEDCQRVVVKFDMAKIQAENLRVAMVALSSARHVCTPVPTLDRAEEMFGPLV